ncbi:hypothetical protein O999_01190 [Pseudomonas putida LF54]|uniref:hypothetical protein n=1 Tax=Pseudomonas TaxID=286 RepID=UPI0003AEDDF7|nr:hypothetical protein [Pseudomonas putida]ERK99230.1 hypothetical protein O999_01190 [Pseudomonas putida LF54]
MKNKVVNIKLNLSVNIRVNQGSSWVALIAAIVGTHGSSVPQPILGPDVSIEQNVKIYSSRSPSEARIEPEHVHGLSAHPKELETASSSTLSPFEMGSATNNQQLDSQIQELDLSPNESDHIPPNE